MTNLSVSQKIIILSIITIDIVGMIMFFFIGNINDTLTNSAINNLVEDYSDSSKRINDKIDNYINLGVYIINKNYTDNNNPYAEIKKIYKYENSVFKYGSETVTVDNEILAIAKKNQYHLYKYNSIDYLVVYNANKYVLMQIDMTSIYAEVTKNSIGSEAFILLNKNDITIDVNNNFIDFYEYDDIEYDIKENSIATIGNKKYYYQLFSGDRIDVSIYLPYVALGINVGLIRGCMIALIVFLNFVLYNSLALYFKEVKKLHEDYDIKLNVDPVTGLNRYERFSKQVKEILLMNFNEESYVLLLFNIDKFQVINDTYGFDRGDKTLKFIADSILELLNNDCKCTRISNDFLVFFKYNNSKQEIFDFMKQLEYKIFQFKEREQMSINGALATGVTIISNAQFMVKHSLTQFVNQCRMAHTKVKGSHADRICFFDVELMRQYYLERDIESEMENAFMNNEFEINYQPKFACIDGSVEGAEALVRWNNKNHGYISPAIFIPIFEENGFISHLDEYIFATVCSNIGEWVLRGLQPKKVSINLSRRNLFNSDLCNMLKRHMDEYNVDPKYLEIEITESVAGSDPKSIQEIIEKIKALGISISIDDFGSGYSSLAILNQIDFSVLKIDKAFIDNIIDDEKSRKIVHYIIALAKSIKVDVVCEGVESQIQARYLAKLGADYIQGYVFSKDLQKAEFERYLKKKTD